MAETGKFEPNPHGTNELLKGEGFYLSYNSRPCDGMGLFRSDRGSEETALAIQDARPDGGWGWLILNGDFRHEYEEAFPRGLEACVAVYESHRATHRSSWSNDGDEGAARVVDWLANRIDNLRENAT